MITIDEITGEIVPQEVPPQAAHSDERRPQAEDRLDERLHHLLARLRQRRRRLSDR